MTQSQSTAASFTTRRSCSWSAPSGRTASTRDATPCQPGKHGCGDAIKAGAAKRSLPLYVHANREADKEIALDMGARAIVHTGYYAYEPSEAHVRRMASLEPIR